MTLANFWRRVWSDKVLWSTPKVRRVFMCCDKCRRVVPAWRMLGRMPMKTGCVCGCTKTWAAHIPEWQAAWWLLIRGRFIRKILLRKENWDPRIPMRELELPQ